jgi:O-Antigen ligase
MSLIYNVYPRNAALRNSSAIATDNILTIFVVVNLVGYPLVAVVTSALGLENTNYSIAMRAFNVLLSIYLIVRSLSGKTANENRWLIALILIIWTCYFIRLTFDTLIAGKFLVREPVDYWIWGVGTCFLPMTASMMQNTRRIDWLRMFFWVFGFFTLTSLLLSIYASQIVNSDLYGTYNSGRTELKSLNPISLGHVGASTLLLSVFFLANSPLGMKLKILISISPLGLGFYILLASNSRGPLFAAITGLLFFMLAVKGKKKSLVFAVFLASAALLVPVSFYLESEYNITTYSRIFGQNFFEEGNVLDRQEMYLGALSDFVASPILGSGLEPSSGRGFPHNIIIETLMSMGLFLGFAIIVLIVELLRRSTSFYRSDFRLGWLCMLMVQFVVGSQFSGSFYEASSFWVAVGMMASLSRLSKSDLKRRNG